MMIDLQATEKERDGSDYERLTNTDFTILDEDFFPFDEGPISRQILYHNNFIY